MKSKPIRSLLGLIVLGFAIMLITTRCGSSSSGNKTIYGSNRLN